CGSSLLGALAYFGLDGIAASEKEEMRQLAMRGGEYTDEEKTALLDYCQTDVDSLAKLLPAMAPTLDLPRSLLRGRYMAAAAAMEFNGVPVDVESLQRFRENWSAIQSQLIAKINETHPVYVPSDSRDINPETTYGAALLAEAEEWGIDPQRLAKVLDAVWM